MVMVMVGIIDGRGGDMQQSKKWKNRIKRKIRTFTVIQYNYM